MPSKLDLFSEIENSGCRRPHGKSDHLALDMDYVIRGEVPKDKEKTQTRRKYEEGNHEGLNNYFQETDWKVEFHNLGTEQFEQIL